MEKFLKILFIIVYLFPTIGLTVAYHFCGDTLISTSIVIGSLQKEPNDCCGENEKENGCCHNQFKSYKLNDLHFASAQIEISKIAVDAIDYTQSTIDNFCTHQNTNQFSNQTHSPPGEDAYLMNRVLRV